ncbi:hypothetical protein HKX48_000688, partial [Thoreauomyces humboldtii]
SPSQPNQPPTHEGNIDDLVRARVEREMAIVQQRRVAFEQRSADAVRREAEDLVRRTKIQPKTPLDADCVAAQEAVVECYRKNPTRTLDCWREVEQMKDTARKAQKAFVEAN